jgi:hypothetical protein
MMEVEMIADDVIDVVAVRHCLMSATGAVYVSFVVSAAVMVGRASVRVACVLFQPVFIDMVAVKVVHVPFVQIVGMAVMVNRGMTATRAVLVVMLLERIARGSHRNAPG